MSFCFPHWQQGLYTNFSPPMSPSTLAKASIVSRGCHFGLPQLQLHVLDADGHRVSMDTSAIISTTEEKSHLAVLEKVPTRLEKDEICLQWEKCQFFMSANEYKGHQIAPVESAPCQTRCTYAVVKAPPPKKCSHLFASNQWSSA